MSKEIKKEKHAVEEVSSKSAKTAKKDNFLKRIGKKLVKLFKDTKGEMKKVTWTPKSELKKNTKLVILSVLAISLAFAVVDTAFTYLFTTVAGLIG